MDGVNVADFNVEYSPVHGGLIYLRRRQVIFLARMFFSGYVLDAGCGDGRYASEIINRGAEHYMGIDLNPKSLLRAKKFCSSSKVDFVRCTLEKFPFKSCCFDGVLCSEVIEHLEAPSKVFSEMYWVLKGKGVLLISVPSQPLPKFTFLLFMNRLGRPIKYFMNQHEHLREYARCSFRDLFEAFSILEERLCVCGFTVLSKSSAWVIGSPILSLVMKPVMSYPLKHRTLAQMLILVDTFLSRVLRSFGTHTIIVCEK
jgi:SAM-dependent methyltransferase